MNVTVAPSDADDGIIGEFCFRWYDLKDGNPPAAMLEAFEDAWPALLLCPEVFGFLAAYGEKNPQPEDLCRYLAAAGYVNENATATDKGDKS